MSYPWQFVALKLGEFFSRVLEENTKAIAIHSRPWSHEWGKEDSERDETVIEGSCATTKPFNPGQMHRAATTISALYALKKDI